MLSTWYRRLLVDMSKLGLTSFCSHGNTCTPELNVCIDDISMYPLLSKPNRIMTVVLVSVFHFVLSNAETKITETG